MTPNPNQASSMSVEELAALKEAAEEYAYNPDTPTCRSGIRGETGIDPELAFIAGAQWLRARSGAMQSKEK